MNKELRELFDQKGIITKKITIKNNVRIIDDGEEQLVIKRRDKNLNSLYQYLKSRSFPYFPEVLYQTENFDIYQYIEDAPISTEERANDLINLVTLLHSKTTFYKDIDEDTYKELYETTLERIEYLEHYYQDILEIIEQEEYMSPANYLFARNVSKLFAALNYCRYQIENWYKIIEEKKRIRIVNLHNNLSLDHYISSEQPYLISWRKSKKDIPIYDLMQFYQKYYHDLDFCELLRNYEMRYPMLKEEKILFFCLISIPEKIEFTGSEYELCKKIQNFYQYLYTTEKLITDYLPKEKDPVDA